MENKESLLASTLQHVEFGARMLTYTLLRNFYGQNSEIGICHAFNTCITLPHTEEFNTDAILADLQHLLQRL